MQYSQTTTTSDPFKVTVTPTFSLSVNGVSADGFLYDSEWNGLVCYKNDKYGKVIFFKEGNSLVSASPALLELYNKAKG